MILTQKTMKITKKYNLPKGYLSYSAIMLWLRSPEMYRRRYYENEEQQESIPMKFGKTIATVFQSRDFKDFPALRKVPYYPVSEQQIIVDVDGVEVKAYLDLWNPATLSIGEVKTGYISTKTGPPWDKVKVRKHEQLPFYSFLAKKMYGKVDPIVHLIWLETKYRSIEEQVGSRVLEGEGQELELTGKIEIFERRIAEWERARIKALILAAAAAISKDYDYYLKHKN